MEIIGERKYVEVPGSRQHELPPLLVHEVGPKRFDQIIDMAAGIVESEDLLANPPVEDTSALQTQLERRKMDLAINLVEQYIGLVAYWNWGDSVLEWIRQCEITFETRSDLRPLLKPDLWPHAGRQSFVQLLADKAVPTQNVDLEKAVGMRLTFRQPPPISCFSNQFLFYLKATVASAAYQAWAKMAPEPISSLPPERFHFEVRNM